MQDSKKNREVQISPLLLLLGVAVLVLGYSIGRAFPTILTNTEERIENGLEIVLKYDREGNKDLETTYNKEKDKIKEVAFQDNIPSHKVRFYKNGKPASKVFFLEDGIAKFKEIQYYKNGAPSLILNYSFRGDNLLRNEITYYKSGNPKSIVTFDILDRWKYTKCFNEKNGKEVKCTIPTHQCTNKSKTCVAKDK